MIRLLKPNFVGIFSSPSTFEKCLCNLNTQEKKKKKIATMPVYQIVANTDQVLGGQPKILGS